MLEGIQKPTITAIAVGEIEPCNTNSITKPIRSSMTANASTKALRDFGIRVEKKLKKAKAKTISVATGIGKPENTRPLPSIENKDEMPPISAININGTTTPPTAQ